MESPQQGSGLMHGIMDWIHSIGLGAVIIWTVLLSFRVGGRNADLSQAQHDADQANTRSQHNETNIAVLQSQYAWIIESQQRIESKLDRVVEGRSHER